MSGSSSSRGTKRSVLGAVGSCNDDDDDDDDDGLRSFVGNSVALFVCMAEDGMFLVTGSRLASQGR